MKLRGIKRIMVAGAVAAATATAGLAGQAQAFEFDQGDLVLALYGNNTEALYNLGPAGTRLADGASFSLDVSEGLAAAAVGTNPVRYTVFGHGYSDDFSVLSVYGATKFAPDEINAAQVVPVQQFNYSINAQAFSVFDGNTVAKSDTLKSFTGNFNHSGAGNFNGAWPVAFQGDLGDILNILEGDANTTGIFTQVGSVQLLDGLLTIGNPGPDPIPLPAGVVLFATGLIGLIGIARRSFNQQAV